MIRELSNKIIFNDFINTVFLTDEEIKILEMYIKKYSIVKIANECNMSERNTSRVIQKIKNKYENFKNIEIAKLKIYNME